jgi:hypothetical protein
MEKIRTREAHGHARILKPEKCSSPACRSKPIVEIRSWDLALYDPPLLLCRKHWEDKAREEPPKTMKVIKILKDIRSYL